MTTNELNLTMNEMRDSRVVFLGQYRVVNADDRNDVLAVFSGDDAAWKAVAYARSNKRTEVQRAIESEDGEIAWYERTPLAEARDEHVERYLQSKKLGVASEGVR